MESNNKLNTGAVPAGPPIFTWWADQMAQTYRLATSATLFPGLATMRYLRLFFQTDVLRDEPAKETPAAMPGRVGAKPPSELEELKRAWQEFEESKGDWSKSR
jgi:hypothetical protein